MRNLKKVLSLVLALAMVLSICMVGAGAVNYDDFTDEESITKKQAVETLVSLDVIKGYNDGATFNPTGNVTRAEMATMICRVLAGGDNMIVDATKPVPTYADIDGHWAESYIEYCTSLGIVSGKSPTSFDPDTQVTAAEAAKMVMTTLGYNADIEGFKGIGWDINTMAKANTLQLLTNLQGEISASVPATREQVAQLLFNALDKPMVQYYEGNSANVWIGAGNTNNKYYETLLETKFNAEKVVGVVVANEWADLDREVPLGKGRTRVIVLGTDNMPTKTELTLNLTTGLDKIGESIIVYRDKASNRVIFGDYQDTGLNQITEFTTYTKDITKGDNAVDKSAKDAAQYVNFSDGVITGSTYKASARFTVRLPGNVKYATDAENATSTDAFAIEETFNRNGTVSFDAYMDSTNDKYDDRVATRNVLTILEAAYDEVNHNSSTKAFLTNADNYDTFEDWCDVYLNSKTNSTTFDATANENGNYIKVVDYNNDGDIDYVLKTVYTASTVKRIAKDGEITLTDTIGVETDCNYIVTSGANKTALTSEDELAAGDVVLYTVIDGTAYISLAETMEHVRIDKVHKNDITVTTEDGDTYNESGVIMVFKVDAMDDLGGVTGKGTDNDKNHSIIDMDGKTDYDLFFDLYGNIVAYRTSINSGTFTLLTDGWFAAWKDGNEYAVKAFIDGKIGTYDVDRGGSTFVKGDKDNTVNNAWGQLKPFGDKDTTTDLTSTAGYNYKTTVASYAQGDDSVDLTAVDQINRNTRRNVDVVSLDVVDIKKGDNKYFNGDAYESGDSKNSTADEYTYFKPATYTTDSEINKGKVNQNENVRVRPRTDTVYYYVYENSSGKLVVDSYEGYTNAPSVDKANINGMYAVGTEYGDYYIANVIVVELSRYLTGGELIFVYDAPEIIDQVGKDRFDIIRKDGTAEEGVVISHNDKLYEGKLYMMYEDGENYSVDVADEVKTAEEFKDNNLYIGTVDEWVDGVREKDYVWIIPQYSNQDDAPDAAIAEVRLELTGDKYYTLGYEQNRQNEWVADLKLESSDDVMAENRGQNADLPNNVLVYTNKDKQVIWAVSFNPDEVRVDNDEHAQDLWKALRPAYVGDSTDYDAILAEAKKVADDKGATKTKTEIETQIKAVQDIFDKLTTYEQMNLARQLVDRNNDGDTTVNDGSLFDALQKALGIANVDEFVAYVLEQEGLTLKTRALETDAAKTLAAAKTLKDAIIALSNTADDDLQDAIEALFKFTPATTTPAAAATWTGDTTMIRNIVLGAVEDKLIALVGDNAEIAAVKSAITSVVTGIGTDYSTKNVATDKLILGITWTIDAAGTDITLTQSSGDSTALTNTNSAVTGLETALGTAETNKENKVVVNSFSGLTNLTAKIGNSVITKTGATISGKNPGDITLNLANGGAAAETYILTLTDAAGKKAEPVTKTVANGANENVTLTVGSGTWTLDIAKQEAATVTVVSANCTVTNADGLTVANGDTMDILTGTSATIIVKPNAGYTVTVAPSAGNADKVTVVKGTNENEWIVTPSQTTCSITVTATQIGADKVAKAKSDIGTATSGDNAIIVSSNAADVSTALASAAVQAAVKAKVDALTLDKVTVTGYEVKDSAGTGSYSAPASQGDTLDATVKVALKSDDNADCTDTANVTVSVRWLHTAATMQTELAKITGLTGAAVSLTGWNDVKGAITTKLANLTPTQPNGTDKVTLVAGSVEFVANSTFTADTDINGSKTGSVDFSYKVQYGDEQFTITDSYELT